MRKKIAILFLLSIFNCIYGDEIYQFENGVPKNFKNIDNSRLSISKEKYKDGESSLKWDFKKGGYFSILGDIGYKIFNEKSKEKARSSFSMWIYNEKPILDELIVEFKKDGKVCSWFPINLNFKGWRTMWVQFDRDMKGKPLEGMDEIFFKAPKVNGTIFIDQIMPSVLIDPRHNARDEQVPFINILADTSVNSHWMALYKNYNQINNENYKNINEYESKDLNIIEERFKNTLNVQVNVTSQLILEKEEKLKEIKSKSLEFIKRLVIFKNINSEKREKIRYIATREFGIFLRELAYMYNSTENNEEKEKIYFMFQESLNYMYDQGWTKGSSQGTIHHLGYQVREIYESIFLMKDPLLKAGKLKEAREMVTWYSAMGIIYTPFEKIRGINVDILNTMLPGMLTSILLNENKNKEASQLLQLSSYLSNSINYSPGVIGGFKEDGSVFHHMQNYPAYAKGAISGLTPIIYYLSNTSFSIENKSYNKVKKAVLMSRIYSNKYNYLLSLTGRHPNDKFQIDDSGFKYMALAKEKEIDKELAEAYMRLTNKSETYEKFKKLGFKEEEAPIGSWTMNMGSLQLHRRDEWLVGIKGYSRYLVGNETYIKNNLYGRYMSYGTFQILENSLKNSGYEQEGWDWAHYPGATAISLPLSKLKSSISQVDIASGVEEMLLSDETYSGGNNLFGDSMFAMKLHEHSKYNSTHRARKSVFLFDNIAILLGSNIENNDIKNETHTTLFQNYLGKNKIKEEIKNYKNNVLIEDSQHNLYKISKGDVYYKKSLQKSKDQNTGEKTENNYELAYINHGTNPKNKAYEYSILIKGREEEKNKFKIDQGYKVLKQDKDAHIVQNIKNNMFAYALFEKQEFTDDKYIKSISTPSMIMLQENNKNLVLSFVNPDLRIYEGIDETQYDKNGIMKEISIYSRKWKGNDSIPYTSEILLNGKYNIKNTKDVICEIKENKTLLKINTTYGEVIKVILEKM